jgi:RNA polymerase sigma-70 factor (ECF subfamily)
MDETADNPLRLREDDYALIRAALVRAVTRICPSWLSSRADDVVQAAMIRVLGIHHRSEGNAQLSPSYLRKVAYSALVDEIRRRRRLNEVPIEMDDGGIDPAAEQASGIPNPEESSGGREVGKAIRDCLRRMVDARRSAVVLHLQGHSVPEIGKLMGWPGKRADNLVYRGLNDLRECLELKGVTP